MISLGEYKLDINFAKGCLQVFAMSDFSIGGFNNNSN